MKNILNNFAATANPEMWNLLILMQTLILCVCAEFPCIPRLYDYDSVVCVCNSTYCDSPKKLPEELQQGYYAQYMSSKNGERLHLSVEPVGYEHQSLQFSNSSLMFQVNTSQRYQHIIGFGGGITDSSMINVASLSQGAQETFMRQYCGDEGIGYTLFRVPMGCTDFSTHFYTYDDVANDTNLDHFNLAYEDLKLKIPYIKKCQELSPRTIKLIATPWSAPKWMKKPITFLSVPTKLDKKYYQIWANYFIKFLDAYKRHGITFWSLSPQNEPFFGMVMILLDMFMGWTPTEIKSFMIQNLVPALHANGYEDIQLIIPDDCRILFPLWFDTFADEKLIDHVSGFAFHWYLDGYFFSPPTYLDYIHQTYEEKLILYTEAGIVPIPFHPVIRLGYWKNAEVYAEHILEDVNHWANAWMDWNLALDMRGGPSYVNNALDSPIIVNSTADEFYKQPMFYAMAHVTTFVPPGSQRIEISDSNTKTIKRAAFLTDEGNIVIVILNRDHQDIDCVITDEYHRYIQILIPANSIHTVVYKL